MSFKIEVDVFYGDKEDCETFSVVFYFDDYDEAKKFVEKYVKINSKCNAKITELYMKE